MVAWCSGFLHPLLTLLQLFWNVLCNNDIFEHETINIMKFKRLKISAMNYHIFLYFCLEQQCMCCSVLLAFPTCPASPLFAWICSFWLSFQWHIIIDILWNSLQLCIFNVCLFNINPHKVQDVAVCLFGCSTGKILESVVYVLVFCVHPSLPEKKYLMLAM